MNQIQVIAKRSKKFLLLYILLFVAVAVLCIIGSTQDKDASVYFIISLVILIPTFLTFLYLLLLPTDAIIKSGDTIIIRYLFTKKVYNISDLQYASHNEKGEWYNRRTDSLHDLNVIVNDIRIVTLTAKNSEGLLVHSRVFVKDATAVTATINAIVEENNEK